MSCTLKKKIGFEFEIIPLKHKVVDLLPKFLFYVPSFEYRISSHGTIQERIIFAHDNGT